MSILKQKSRDTNSSDPSTKAVVAKALTAASQWPDKDEFLDVLYWLRQIIGLVLGIAWGILPIKGLLGIVLFLAVNMAVIYIYFSIFQKVDEEDYGGISEIFKEGLMTSFATFIVAWIIIYSALHAD